jgi:hypothetical protein
MLFFLITFRHILAMLCQSNFGCVATLITMMPTALTVIYPIMVSCVFKLCLQRSLYLSFFTLFCIPAFSLLLNGVAQLGFQLLSVFLSLNFHLSLMCLCYFFQRFLSFLVFRFRNWTSVLFLLHIVRPLTLRWWCCLSILTVFFLPFDKPIFDGIKKLL